MYLNSIFPVCPTIPIPIIMPTPHEKAIASMNSASNNFSVTIVCTSDDHQANYWMSRLSSTVCHASASSSKFPMVLAVSEDWSAGGAGNGLGTLYAFQKAALLATKLHSVDLATLLHNKEISVGLFHTAGKGTRLAPLPASENNNKPGVKLPVSTPCTASDGTKTNVSLTILEAVIKQTAVYAQSRLGRLSVFWGDQVRVLTTKI